MYTALYRRFRPETFDQVLGQEHIVKILSNQINNGQTGHAYLFCGTRGTGKTTMARLLAKGVNCLSDSAKPCGTCAHCMDIKEGVFVDVIEIDAASNNGVENIRELKESVKYPPSIGRCKVYIIDEVHMLSTGAFNALLKTLEEPPENVMFILATTEPQKLPATILSRCLRLDFKRVPANLLKQGMKNICDEMGCGITEEALSLLASNADGSVRDGLSLLDQCVSAGESEITRESVLSLVGSPGEARLTDLTGCILAGEITEALILLNDMLMDGGEERQLMRDWIGHFRNLLLLKYVKKPEDVLNMSVENIDALREQSGKIDLGVINKCVFILAKTLDDARWSTCPRVLLELAMIKMATGEESQQVTAQPSQARPMPAKAAQPRSAAPSPEPQEMPSAIAESHSDESVNDAPAEPKISKPKPAQSSSDEPLEEIWKRTLDAVAKERGMLSRLAGRSNITSADGSVIHIECSDEITKRAIEDSRQMLEAQLEKESGLERRLECRLECSVRVDEGKTDEPSSVLAEIEKKLNINVEFE